MNPSSKPTTCKFDLSSLILHLSVKQTSPPSTPSRKSLPRNPCQPCQRACISTKICSFFQVTQGLLGGEALFFWPKVVPCYPHIAWGTQMLVLECVLQVFIWLKSSFSKRTGCKTHVQFLFAVGNKNTSLSLFVPNHLLHIVFPACRSHMVHKASTSETPWWLASTLPSNSNKRPWPLEEIVISSVSKGKEVSTVVLKGKVTRVLLVDLQASI